MDAARPLPGVNTSGQGRGAQVPPEISGRWNWFAFLFPTVFAGVNRLWLWLLIAAVPAALISLNILSVLISSDFARGFAFAFGGAQFALSIFLAVRGNDLAWRSRRWESVQDFKRTQRRWAWGTLVALMSLGGLGGFLEFVDGNPSAVDAPLGSADFHRANLADGETALLAAMLVDVPGYHYVDAADSEVQNALDQVDRSAVPGLSLHVVVDRDGEEVAFLQLYEFAPGFIPDDVDPAVVVEGFSGLAPSSRTVIEAQEVFLIEDPGHPQSRYMYVWVGDGTLAAADSGDQTRLLAWLQAYLPIVEPADSSLEPDASPGTFTRSGISFRYPREWRVRDARTPFGGRWDVHWTIKVSPTRGLFRHEGIRVIAFPYRGADVVTERLSALAEDRGEIEGPTSTSIRALPAFEGRIHDYMRYGRLFEFRVVTIVDGATAFEIVCQYQLDSTEVVRGCDRVFDSFHLGG